MIPIQDKGESKEFRSTTMLIIDIMNEWASEKGAGTISQKYFGEVARKIAAKVLEWLKPIPQSSLKEETGEQFQNLIKYNMNDAIGSAHWFNTLMANVLHIGEYMKTHDRINFNEILQKDWGEILYNTAKDMFQWHSGQSSLTPKSIRDGEATLIEEIRQIKAAIIHFATLDKMPTLELLDREQVIAHVVTIAQNILNKYPPKNENSK